LIGIFKDTEAPVAATAPAEEVTANGPKVEVPDTFKAPVIEVFPLMYALPLERFKLPEQPVPEATVISPAITLIALEPIKPATVKPL